MTRFVIAALVIFAATVATAGGGTRPDDRATRGVAVIGTAATTGPSRPDDRANHGPGAVALNSSNEAVRPDDRAWRGLGPEPTVAVAQSPSVRVDGFDWADAGIGAAAAVGFGVLLVGASALVRRRQRVTAFS